MQNLKYPRERSMSSKPFVTLPRKLPKSLKPFFWDVRFEQLDGQRDGDCGHDRRANAEQEQEDGQDREQRTQTAFLDEADRKSVV